MKLKLLSLIFAICALFSSCVNDDPIPENCNTKTVLVYMLANNSLSSFGNTNMEQMRSVATTANLKGGHLLVYQVSPGISPRLIEFKDDGKGNVTQNVVKEYSYTNSADPEVMQTIISDVKTMFSATNYGLVLWSHGTSWLPSDYRSHLRSFGQDGTNWMEIDEVAKGIPDNLFNFILFDACYMSSIECVYELKDKAQYILGSPTETMGDGWPYQLIVPYFFLPTPDVNKVAETFYNYYNAKIGDYQTATVSVIKTEALQELAAATRAILSDKSADVLYGADLSKMQRLEYLYGSPGLLYDFSDYIEQLATPEQFATFKSALSKATSYEAHTPNAFFASPQRSYPIDHTCGLTSYVLRSQFPSMNDWYASRLRWYEEVYK